MYPAVEAYDRGGLDVGDGQCIFWEECGNPSGVPVVVLHGGPGSGCADGLRRFFDPDAYRIVLYDQRGCGRSTPHAGDPAVDLATNTTAHLLDDLERLRDARGVDRWLVFGISWGVTLGLAYAQRNPDHVAAMVLAGVTTGRRRDIDWLYRDIAPLFPEEWARFQAAAGDALGGNLVAAYRSRLADPDPGVRAEAAAAWTAWDWATASVAVTGPPAGRWADPDFQLARARICTHYFHHDCFLADGELIRGAPALAGVPGVLVNGRLDLQAPLATAWELAGAWPGSELVVVEGAGHSTAEAGMAAAVVAATDRFRSLGSS